MTHSQALYEITVYITQRDVFYTQFILQIRMQLCLFGLLVWYACLVCLFGKDSLRMELIVL